MKQVSRIILMVRDGAQLRLAGQPHNTWLHSHLEPALGRLPDTTYRVTYRLSRTGYKVDTVEGCYHAIKANGERAIICFLPRAWNGKRVSRTVKVL